MIDLDGEGPSGTSFTLGPWRIDPKRNCLMGDGQTQYLEQRVMRVLLHLSENPGVVVTRESLLEQVWPDTIVNEHSLTAAISALRRAFGENFRKPEVIETIPKVGYRLMVDPKPYQPLSGSEPQASPNSGGLRSKRWLFAVGALLLVFMVTVFPSFQRDRPVAPVQPIPLTSYPGGEFDPALSPDEKQMAFVWRDSTGNFDIYLKGLHEENPKRLTFDPAFEGSPAWSPEGDAIAFMRSKPSQCGVFILTLDTGVERRIADCTHHDESSVAWSPSNNLIAFTDRSDLYGPLQIFAVDSLGGSARPLTKPGKNDYGDRDPAFSSDGRFLAFVRGVLPSSVAPEISPTIGDIYVQDLHNHALRRITKDHGEVPGLAWIPDTNSLIFASNREGGDYALWQTSSHGGTPRWILNTGDLIRNPVVGARKGLLVYEQWERDSNIWTMPLGESTAQQEAKVLIASTRWESHPQFSPDGSRIAFSSDRSGFTEIWVCDSAGQNLHQITHFSGPRTNNPKWSPDGSWLAFESWQQGFSKIWGVPATGGKPRILVEMEAHAMAPSFSNNGRNFYFASNRSGSWQIWAKPFGKGHARQITQQGGFQAAEKGHYLFFSRLDRPGLWRRDERSGHVQQVIQDLLPQDWDNWTLGPNGIYFIRRHSLDRAAVARISFDTLQVQELQHIETHRILGRNGLSVSADGRTLLFTKLDRLVGDILSIPNFQAH